MGSSVVFEEDAPGSLFNEIHWASASVSGANEVLILAILIAFAEREAVVPKSRAAATFPVFFGWLVVTLNAFCILVSCQATDQTIIKSILLQHGHTRRTHAVVGVPPRKLCRDAYSRQHFADDCMTQRTLHKPRVFPSGCFPCNTL